MGSRKLESSLDDHCKSIGWYNLTPFQETVLANAETDKQLAFNAPKDGGGKIGAFLLHILDQHLSTPKNPDILACILSADGDIDKIRQDVNLFARDFGLACVKVSEFRLAHMNPSDDPFEVESETDKFETKILVMSPTSLVKLNTDSKWHYLLLADIALLKENDEAAVVNNMMRWGGSEQTLIFSSSRQKFDGLLYAFKSFRLIEFESPVVADASRDSYYVAYPGLTGALLLAILRKLKNMGIIIFTHRCLVSEVTSVLEFSNEKFFAANLNERDLGLAGVKNFKICLKEQKSRKRGGRSILVCGGNGNGLNLPTVDVVINYVVPTPKDYQLQRVRIGPLSGKMISLVLSDQVDDLKRICSVGEASLSEDLINKEIPKLIKRGDEKVETSGEDHKPYVRWQAFSEKTLIRLKEPGSVV